jgi:hypothetical protein
MPKKFVLVAIGGTGMRVAQSVVSLAASGFLSDKCACDYRLEIRLVDLDIVPGSDKVELEEMIKNLNAAIPYMSIIVDDDKRNARWKPKKIEVGDDNHVKFFSTKIDDKSTLDHIVTNLNPYSDAEALTFHALFGKDDRSMELRRGCKGRPRIGSLLWAESFDKDWESQAGFWRGIFDDMATGDELRVMFAGSVFGGTGASGTPTLAQKYRNACINEMNGDLTGWASHIGLTLMLPYFDIGQDTDVDCTLFSINSKMALKYYESSDALNGIEFTQFLGDDRRQMQKKNGAGEWKNVRLDRKSATNEGQNDPSMPAELMAGVGICRFFADDIPNKVFVPLKWKNEEPEESVARGKKVPMDSFDYFPVAKAINVDSQVKSLKDYILRLERFYLMLGEYYYRIAEKGHSWSYRPEAFRTTWGRVRKIDEIYKSNIEGIGLPLDWAVSSFRWLEELDHHGLHSLLEIEGDVNEHKLHISEFVQQYAEMGATDFNVCGIPCADITSAMNSMSKDESAPTKYFVSSLMECCIDREYKAEKVEA